MTPSERAADRESIPRPGWRLLLLEGRAVLELAAVLTAYPFLRRAPHGDGHPVLVIGPTVTRDRYRTLIHASVCRL